MDTNNDICYGNDISLGKIVDLNLKLIWHAQTIIYHMMDNLGNVLT